VAQLAIDLYPRNWLELSPRPAGFATEPGPKPMATALTRWQITQGALVTDLRHRSVSITDPFTRQLLPYLDGSREREALISIMGEFERDNSTDAANDDPETVLAAALHQLAERCLLVQ